MSSTTPIEQKVISTILSSKQGVTFFVENAYEVDQVFNTYKDLAQVIFKHYNEFHSIPSFEILNKLCLKQANSSLLLDQITEVQLTEPDESQLKYWVKELIEYKRKSIIEKALISATDAMTKGEIELATKILEKGALSSEDLVNRNLIKTGDLGADAKNRYKEYLYIKDNPDCYRRIPTGFGALDENIGGVGPGELNIMLGRTGTGKSMFLLNVAYNAWKDYERNVFFFSYEMPIAQVQKRLDARHACLDYKKIKNGELGELEIKRYEAMLKDMARRSKKAAFKIIKPPQKTTTNLVRNEINKLIKTQGIKPDLIVLDYMALMAPTRVTKDQKETDRLGEIALDCRNLAIEYDIPVWTACQVNRPGAREKNIGTDNVFGSDQVSHHADMMLALKKNETDIDQFAETNHMEIQAVKMRDGACRNIEIYYDFSFCLMCDKKSSQSLGGLI